MSHKVNLVRVFTAATGTSTPITLGSAYSQLFMTPAEAGAMDGRVYTYLIVDGNDWEMGRGAYTASGTSLARTTIIASRISGTLGTSRITLTGTAQVRFIEAAEDMDGVRGTRAVTGTSDVLANSDQGYVVTYNNGSAVAVSLAQAGASNLFLGGWATMVQNIGAGTVTITPATSTINGNATLALASGMGAFVWSDGTNYRAYFIPASKPLLAKDNLNGITDTEVAQGNLGASTVGKGLFTAASAAAARGTLGAGTVGGALFTSAAAADAHTAIRQSVRVITGADTIVASDIGKMLIFNSASAFTVALTAAATLGNGFWCRFKNVNSGLVTIDPNSSETIDGLATTIVPKFDSGMLVCDGTSFQTLERPVVVLLDGASVSNVASVTMALPSGFDRFELSFSDVEVGTPNSDVLGTISTDGGSTYASSGYQYGGVYGSAAAATGAADYSSSGSVAAFRLVPSTGNGTSQGASGIIDLYAPTNNAHYHRLNWRSSFRTNSGTELYHADGGVYAGTTAWTNFKLAASAGNIYMRWHLRGYRGFV